MILVIGSRGIVSTAVQNHFANQAIQVVESNIVKNWIRDSSEKELQDFISSLPTKPSKILNCAGITDPKLPEKLLMEVNFELPKKLLTISEKEEIDLITFGSVMEKNQDFCSVNPYLKSKKEYFDLFKSSVSMDSSHLHLQLHTLYGGMKLHRHMFLGQMFEAIQNRLDFKMTEGTQLREYHHVVDDIQALSEVIKTNRGGIVEISHQEKLTLRSIAEHVFSEFGIPDRLKVGDLPNPSIEQYDLCLSDESQRQVEGFRPSLFGITQHLRELLDNSK